tara:strand:- start:20375 stop:21151 length:777 start_codon:yes stop_codon:yes gene_type:complete
MECNILVIGDSCDDEYIYGDCSRLNPEGPIPVLDKTSTEVTPGMASNVNDNLRSFGVRTNLITQKETIKKTRFVDRKSNYQLLRVDTTPEVTPLSAPQVRMAFMHSKYDALVISDYDKGFLTDQALRIICTYFKGPIFIDTKKTKLFQQPNVFFKINKKEYDLLDREFMPHDTNLIVTLGSNGCRWRGINFTPRKVNVFDVCGAGDTFLSALVVEFIRTKDMQNSINFANMAASISVENSGTYKLTRDDIMRIYNGQL